MTEKDELSKEIRDMLEDFECYLIEIQAPNFFNLKAVKNISELKYILGKISGWHEYNERNLKQSKKMAAEIFSVITKDTISKELREMLDDMDDFLLDMDYIHSLVFENAISISDVKKILAKVSHLNDEYEPRILSKIQDVRKKIAEIADYIVKVDQIKK